MRRAPPSTTSRRSTAAESKCARGTSTAAESKRARLQPHDDVLMLLSRNVLARSLLELATSFLGVQRLRQEKLLAFRKLFDGSHSLLFNA